MVQLAADRISETEPLETCWKNKAETQNGRCKFRAKAWQTLSCTRVKVTGVKGAGAYIGNTAANGEG